MERIKNFLWRVGATMVSSCRMNWRTRLLTALAVSIFNHATAIAGTFLDPLDTAALMSPSPDKEPLIAVTAAGSHYVAVGLRGVALVSDNATNSWLQATVPVQSDLVAVQFVDAKDGWACGHDGVVLHTSDGGRSWVKQLDGISARKSFESYYANQTGTTATASAQYLHEIQENYDPGPYLPWLGVWFSDDKKGYIVGAFGDIAFTSDGGKTWQPWLQNIDNPGFLDLDAINSIGGNLYIVGEQGGVYLLDKSKQKFIARPTGYMGSLFGITGTATTLVVFGLNGAVYRSTNQGKSWSQSSDQSESSISAGTVLPDGRVVLVTVYGNVLISDDDGKSFQTSDLNEGMALSGVTNGGKNMVILSGLSGVRDAVVH